MKNSSDNGEAGGLPSAGSAAWAEDPQEGRSPLSETMQQVIGSQLKAVYDEVIRQPVPDRFLELLSQLDERTKSPDLTTPDGVNQGKRA